MNSDSLLVAFPSIGRFSARESSPFATTSSQDKREREHSDWRRALPTIWCSPMESTWGGVLCWQRAKQGTKWTPAPIKIHQDIWIGCPVSKLCAGIQSKIKWNVPHLHIRVIITVSECVWHTPKWTNLLNWPLWFFSPEKVIIRSGQQIMMEWALSVIL